MSSTTRSLINALRVLDSEIQSQDGVANAVIAEAATRLEELQDRIKRLEDIIKRAGCEFFKDGPDSRIAVNMLTVLDEARESKP